MVVTEPVVRAVTTSGSQGRKLELAGDRRQGDDQGC